MKNVFVYCELTEETEIADVSLELLSKGRELANELSVGLEAIVIGAQCDGIEKKLFPYGVDVVNIAEDERLSTYSTLPHFAIVSGLFKDKQPEIALFGATSTGRDLAPRLASRLKCGLTADCTALEIEDYTETKSGKVYPKLLYQIRPAFGGNIIATIINPETRPQMATVREGVMKKEIYNAEYKGIVHRIDISEYLSEEDFILNIIERKIEKQGVNIKNAPIIVSGGYGMGCKENFKKLHELAELVGGEVGATRAAADSGFTEAARQIGQTGVTVRPKLYIACGISGAVQHTAGMNESGKIISINTDPEAPINALADYTIIGDVNEVVQKMIEHYKNRKS